MRDYLYNFRLYITVTLHLLVTPMLFLNIGHSYSLVCLVVFEMLER